MVKLGHATQVGLDQRDGGQLARSHAGLDTCDGQFVHGSLDGRLAAAAKHDPSWNIHEPTGAGKRLSVEPTRSDWLPATCAGTHKFVNYWLLTRS
jgi:hypothetical protein